MSTWEYRVLHDEHEVEAVDNDLSYNPGGTEHSYSIIEAYYREGTEEVELWSQPEDTHPSGESIAELGADLSLMMDALLKPPLERRDLPGG